MNLPEVVEINRQKNDGENAQRIGERIDAERESGAAGASNEIHQQQIGQVIQKGAKQQTQADANHRQNQGFIKQDSGNVPPLHAQNAVEAKFLFPLLHEEAAGVEQKNCGENCDDKAAQGCGHGDFRCAPLMDEVRHPGDIPENMEYRYHE